jgi:hypothetical protein
MYTASMPAAAVPAKPRDPAPAKPKEVAKSAPAPRAPAPEMRTAFSAPQSDDGVLLRGAQPVVPAGSFESRWTALH